MLGTSSFLATDLGAQPEAVEGPTLEEAEAGMAEMSERYRDGGDLYVLAGS